MKNHSTKTADASAEAIHIDPEYANRSGYNTKFLTGFTVPLPKLSDPQRKYTAKNMDTKQSEDPYELKYQHFSIVMNAKRRMAFFAAVNIDGSKWITIDRGTGEPSEASEAAEVWFEDPRIKPAEQCHQDMYSHQQPRLFDQGHLVRRQDPP
jgi:endonuclease G